MDIRKKTPSPPIPMTNGDDPPDEDVVSSAISSTLGENSTRTHYSISATFDDSPFWPPKEDTYDPGHL